MVVILVGLTLPVIILTQVISRRLARKREISRVGLVMKNWKTAIIVPFTLTMFASMVQAQQTFQVMGCSSCKVLALSQSKSLTIYSLTGGGPAWSATRSKVFNDMKWEFVATITIMDGKTKGVGYYKFIDPDEDYFILEATGAAITEGGTWRFLYGTGKWIGATGELRGRTTLRGRPLSVEAENYWCRISGTLELLESADKRSPSDEKSN